MTAQSRRMRRSILFSLLWAATFVACGLVTRGYLSSAMWWCAVICIALFGMAVVAEIHDGRAERRAEREHWAENRHVRLVGAPPFDWEAEGAA